MSWKKVKSKITGDSFDEDFENFMNESLSDDSPRRSITPKASNPKFLSRKAKTESEDEDLDGSSVLAQIVQRTWKIHKENEENNDNSTKDSPRQTSKKEQFGMSKDSLDFAGSRPSTALDTILSESEKSESLQKKQDYSEQTEATENVDTKSKHLDNAHESDYSDDFMSEKQDELIDTLDAQMKEKFFENIEKDGTVDFHELNQQFNRENDLTTPQGETVEITGLTPYNHQYSDDESKDETESPLRDRNNDDSVVSENDDQKDESYHKDDSNVHDSDSVSREKTSNKNANYSENHTGTDKGDLTENETEEMEEPYGMEGKAKTLLSKVQLMESLESTGGLQLAEKLAKFQTKEKSATEPEPTKIPLSESIYIKQTEEEPEAFEPSISQSVKSGQLILDTTGKTDTLQLNQFSLQPIVSNFAEEPQVPAFPIKDGQDLLTSVPTLTTYDEGDLLDTLQKFQRNTNEDANNNSEQSVDDILQDPKQSAQVIRVNIDAANYDYSDSDSPCSEGLRSIKSIAEQRRKQKQSKIESKSESKNEIKYESAKIPVPTKSSKKKIVTSQQRKQKVKKSLPKPKVEKSPLKPKVEKTPPRARSKLLGQQKRSFTKQSPSVLTAQDSKHSEALLNSVESFASYLKDFAHTNKPETKHLDHSSHAAALEREQLLQRELRDIRALFEDERKTNEKMLREWLFKEKRWNVERDKLSQEHKEYVSELKDEILVWKKKDEINTYNDRSDKPAENDGEELNQLHQRLEQQESLLSGYQQENERLYAELKKSAAHKKHFEVKLVKENQKMALELGNLKEKINARPPDSTEGSASLGAQRIAQLENQVKFYQAREQESKLEIENLENEVRTLRNKLEVMEKTRNSQQVNTNVSASQKNYEQDIDRLQKKLLWYAKNQQLLDKDSDEIRQKNEEVKKLKIENENLEKENEGLKEKSKNNDTKIISDLKRQIREMEEVIRRRHPNSIPAMIYAASAVPGKSVAYNTSESMEKTRREQFLEKRVNTVQGQLDERDQDHVKKVRALEQRYNSLALTYEAQNKELSGKLEALIKDSLECSKELEKLSRKNEDVCKENYRLAKENESLSTENLKISKDALTKEQFAQLETIAVEYQNEVKRKNDELNLKNNEIKMLKERLETKEGNRERSGKSWYSKSRNKDRDENTLNDLIDKIKKRDSVIEELQTTLSMLQKEREKLLNRKPIESSKSDHVIMRNQMTSPIQGISREERKVKEENAKLKNTIQELRLLCEERRLKNEAVSAEMSRDRRINKEEYDNKLNKLQAQHKSEVETMRMQFVVEHSNSRVAELKGELNSTQLVVQHLKGVVEELKQDQQLLKQTQEIVVEQREKIRNLNEALFEAEKAHTPEMRHYRMLEAKLNSMEIKRTERETEIRRLIEKTKAKPEVIAAEEIESKWRDALREKDAQIERFREELDQIIEVLQELQRQGVVLPVISNNGRFNYNTGF